ncbi:MAG: flagellar biosynthetic protein FliR [Verrucomicrobiota bacterium]
MFWDITTWFMIFVRLGSYLLVFPLTAAQTIPVMIRLGLAAFGAFLVMPSIQPVILDHTALFDVLRMMFVEVSAGLILAMLARFLFYGIEIAGTIISTESGLMMSSNFNPLTSSMGSAPGAILHWMTLVLLLTLNLHHWILIGIKSSYDLIPVGGAHLSEFLLQQILLKSSGMFVAALQMTAPILAASFLVTLVFSLLGRAVPQMNVFSESFPARSCAGLAVFGLTLNLMAQHIVNQLNRIPEDFVRIARILGS